MKISQFLLTSVLLLCQAALPGDDKVEAIPNLVCFWDFNEEEGKERVSRGEQQYSLEEVNGPIVRVEGATPGKQAVRIKAGQYFRIP